MKVKILREAGYQEAMLGLSLSYGVELDRAMKASHKLYKKDGGHNKFLESIVVWLDIIAPRYWWSQADTYRIGTKQSESTMHTLMKKELTNSNFIDFIHPNTLGYLNKLIRDKNFEKIKCELPEGFLQRRIWRVDYKTLRNIISQRRQHKLREWKMFCDEILVQIEHQEYFIDFGEYADKKE